MVSPPSTVIRQIDVRAASDTDYARLSDFSEQIRAERQPEDPAVSLGRRLLQWRNIPAFLEVQTWVVPAHDEAMFVAMGSFSLRRLDENSHAAEFDIAVLPAYRRQGLGRRLLVEIAEAAKRERRRLLLANTTDRVPDGAAFLQRIGARKGLESHINQLRLTELNRPELADWLQRGPALGERFELVWWDHGYPDAELPAIVALVEVMNQAPRGELELEDQRETPERLRAFDAMLRANGTEHWTLAVRERQSGAFAGFTDVFWHPERPAILDQGDTGVWPQYRNHGLGRWLKAVMLDRILRERPQVAVVRTQNADSNVPMLTINQLLGFRPYMARTVWQVTAEHVREYLAS